MFHDCPVRCYFTSKPYPVQSVEAVVDGIGILVLWSHPIVNTNDGRVTLGSQKTIFDFLDLVTANHPTCVVCDYKVKTDLLVAYLPPPWVLRISTVFVLGLEGPYTLKPIRALSLTVTSLSTTE